MTDGPEAQGSDVPSGALSSAEPSDPTEPSPWEEPDFREAARSEYMLGEASVMGERIQWYLEQQENLETTAILGSGAIWAFVLALNWSEAVSYLTWIPFFVCLLLAIKSQIFTRTINEAFDYLSDLEDHFGMATYGWVHFFRARSGRYKRRWRNSFWALIVLANMSVALFVPFESLLTDLNVEAPPPADNVEEPTTDQPNGGEGERGSPDELKNTDAPEGAG